MNETIIGGAIAAAVGIVSGVITGVLLEHRREKGQKLTIVDALIIETTENLVICNDFEERELWWTTSFKLEYYDAYKGQLRFLPEDVRVGLVNIALTMKDWNDITRVLQQEAVFGQNFSVEPMSPPRELIEKLESVNKGLRKWRQEHTGFCRRLQNFISKNRNNSKLSHS